MEDPLNFVTPTVTPGATPVKVSTPCTQDNNVQDDENDRKFQDELALHLVEEITRKCYNCGERLVDREMINIMSLFPLPSKQEVLLTIIGCNNLDAGTERDDCEVLEVLNL